VSSDTLQMLALACLAYYEICMVKGTNPFFIYLWDFIAVITGMLANFLGAVSMQARLNYFEAVEA
jgi:hypothetical protein